VKTRFIPALGAGGAAALHRALLADSLRLLKSAAPAAGATAYLSFSEPWRAPRRGPGAAIARAAAGIARLPQTNGDLGRRMRATLRRLLRRGHDRVVIIGSDAPTLPPAWIARAFHLLEAGSEVVLGPARDGGYYLLGARRLVPGMFSGIPWGTGGVLESTRRALRSRGVTHHLLPAWYDIDRPADLRRARGQLLGSKSRGAGRHAAGARPFAARRTAALLRRLSRPESGRGGRPSAPSDDGRAGGRVTAGRARRRR
jgi:hypothetical protein